MKRVRIAALRCLVAVEFLGCMGDENVKLEYRGYAPLQANDGWVISTPENENMEAALVESAFRLVYDEERFVMSRSLLVLRNGKLVAEAYPHDEADIWQIQNLAGTVGAAAQIPALATQLKRLTKGGQQ